MCPCGLGPGLCSHHPLIPRSSIRMPGWVENLGIPGFACQGTLGDALGPTPVRGPGGCWESHLSSETKRTLQR